METIFNKDIMQSFEKTSSREWIETNGLGGWASSTISGCNTRGYHGLLVVATRPPVGRVVMVSKLDEVVRTPQGKHELSSNVFTGAVCNEGNQYLQKFHRKYNPEFEYKIGAIEIKKSILSLHNSHRVMIRYEILNADTEFEMDFKPLIAGKDYHDLAKQNDYIEKKCRLDEGVLAMQPYVGLPEVYIFLEKTSFTFNPEWYLNFEYQEEKNRGLNHHEDLFSYGHFTKKVKKGDVFYVQLSDQKEPLMNPSIAWENEIDRRIEITKKVAVQNPITQTLALAADQFVVKRNENLKTIIAGYHWFSDWGRDTMISLPGLCLVTGNAEDAKKILVAFAEYFKQGLIPNRFPDQGETPEYNTVDATLWYFIAVKKYYDYTKDVEFIRNIYPKLAESIRWHEKGTMYDIHVEADGLLFAGEFGVQLTWMDAKIGSWVVTPRMGKPVEINALWYNALCIMNEFAVLLQNNTDAAMFLNKVDRVKKSFAETFVIPNKNHLYDYVNMYEKNDDIRPNQTIALSLPYEILPRETAKKVLQTIEEQLLTPVGLRTLNTEHHKYEGSYSGNSWSRDGAYHQGTVWPWLLGPYITAKVRLEGESGKQQMEQFVQQFQLHFNEAGIGTVSEIFDGDKPHTPKGCMAQAWSVAEVLRAYIEDVCGVKP